MAYTISLMYNLNQSVGPGCPNRMTDVMLVQSFLSLMSLNSGFPPMAFNPAAYAGCGPESIYPSDGVYKPELAQWIKGFQTGANKHGLGPLIVDSKVNASNVAWGNKNIKQSARRTLQVMNSMLQLASSTRFENLHNDVWIPAPLQAEMKQMRLSIDLLA